MERPAEVSERRSPSVPDYNVSTSTLAFDRHFTRTAKGILLLAEIVCGMLVWILVGGTEYFHLSALCWVMFVAISCWVLTVCLFITDLTGAHKRIPQVPWTTLVTYYLRNPLARCIDPDPDPDPDPNLNLTNSNLTPKTKSLTQQSLLKSLCLNCGAAALYLAAAVADALSANQATRGRHNYNCWAASAFFAFLTTLCYAGSSYLSYRTWKTTEEEK
ncbi:hypothetical protein F2P81_001664 [Scophthalmus maximus]|uniref:MARVEL domain-containing protein n=1 Tax=Scophthalmus maximus TaxID=52904 RepID=A0A6A4TIU7_SCOMX|nr:hypothetical protein F2P81_001664 [Scophthalmus maximus]